MCKISLKNIISILVVRSTRLQLQTLPHGMTSCKYGL